MARPKAPTKAEQIMADVNKALGDNTIRMASHKSLATSFIPTGLLPIDILLQGGMPRGRFVELYGDYSTLKSYVALNTAAATQAQGGVACIIDTEHAFEPEWARSVGVNVDDLVIWPDREDGEVHTGEEAFDVAQMLIAQKVDFIAFDSIAAALPQAESNKRLHNENIQPARLAMLMSAGLRRLTATNSQTSMLFINQTRLNIGITFGSNEALPGGKAMPFYASYRVALRKTGKITKDTKYFDGQKWAGGKEQIGQKFKAEVTKSKLSKPFRDIWFDWNLVNGQIDLPGFIIAQGVEVGIIAIKGNTWDYRGKKAVGREKFKALVANDPAIMMAIENEVRSHHGIGGLVMTPQAKAGKPVVRSRGASAPAKKKAIVRRSA